MKLLNTLIIIFGLSINQVFCDRHEDEMLERHARGIIDISPPKIMNLIKHGDSSNGVPIFDPYIIPNYDLNINENDVTIIGKLKGVNIQGLSDMENLDTDHDFWRRKIKLTLVFPWIFSEGISNIDKINSGSNYKSVYANYTAIMNDVKVTVNLAYALVKNTVTLEGLNIDDILSIQIFVIGKFNDEETGNIITRNEKSDEKALDFCKRYHITDLITETFGNTLRAIFKGKTIPQIKKLLT